MRYWAIFCVTMTKVKGQILIYFVNASPHKRFDVVTSNSVDA